MTTKSIPKRHHTVAAFVLNRFAADGKLRRLDVTSGANIAINPEDATVFKHFYTVEEPDGSRSGAVEEVLSQIEGVAAPLVERIVEGRRFGGTERAEVALFLATTWLRTPKWRYDTQSIMEQTLEVWFAETNRQRDAASLRVALGEFADGVSDQELERMRDEWVSDLEQGRLGIEIPPNNLIKVFLQHVTQMGWLMFCMDWIAVLTDKSHLIISDTPASLIDLEPPYPGSAAGLLSSGMVEFFLPLDPHVGLLVVPNPETLQAVRDLAHRIPKLEDEQILAEVEPLEGRWSDLEIEQSRTLDLNFRTYCHADKYVFGTQQAVTQTHAAAKADPVRRRALTPAPPRLQMLENDPSRPGQMRATNIIEPRPRTPGSRMRH